MKTLFFRKPNKIVGSIRGDCRMMQIAFREMGYRVSLEDIYQAWKKHSDEEFSAGWMSLTGLNIETTCRALICPRYLEVRK